MRVFRFDKLQSLDDLTLHNEPMPEPQRGEVLVKIHAVSLNRRDIMIAQGDYPAPVTPGLIPCSDAAGEIVAVGDDVTAYKPGDRVINTFHPRWFGGRAPLNIANETYGNCQDGWLAEYKAISQEAVVPIPDSLTWEEGSTLPCAGVTAWNALSGHEPIRAGQTVLTLGSGDVSIFAIQLAKAVGATVVGTTSSDSKGEVLKKLGVDHVVNYSQVKEWGRYVKQDLTHGIGFDCVVEVVGPATLNDSLAAVRWGGEVVLIGQLSKENPGIDPWLLKQSGAILRSIGVGDRPMLEDLVRAIEDSGLKPAIDQVFAFEECKQAFERLQGSGHLGKIVIRVGQ